jgi:hypothetical protein
VSVDGVTTDRRVDARLSLAVASVAVVAILAAVGFEGGTGGGGRAERPAPGASASGAAIAPEGVRVVVSSGPIADRALTAAEQAQACQLLLAGASEQEATDVLVREGLPRVDAVDVDTLVVFGTCDGHPLIPLQTTSPTPPIPGQPATAAVAAPTLGPVGQTP